MPSSSAEQPEFCQYAGGRCEENLGDTGSGCAVVLYPSSPQQIARTIETAIDLLDGVASGQRWITWKRFGIAGQVIFCSICKAMRGARLVVADVTTLNFNLLFEIGFALGLELPVLPIRDTSYSRDQRQFDELGFLDTIGYVDFRNSQELANALRTNAQNPTAVSAPVADISVDSPLYVLKGPLNTEGEIKLLSTLKKSMLRFRTYDVVETPRLSLHQLRKQVVCSLGVVTHLLSPHREGATVHNARCALAAGMAMSLEKNVLMLQEDDVPQPIDYRDVVVNYTDPAQVPKLVEPTILQGIQALQVSKRREIRAPAGLLQSLDIGDIAAENEIRPLRSYFLETAQYNQARRGHARLVVGRKGAGKTAIFYAIRDSFGKSHSRVVLDLKPEGHQFTRLRESILERLLPGLQEHTLTAFWNSILLAELAHKIVSEEFSWARRDPQRWQQFSQLESAYRQFGLAERGDFSERLLNQVSRLEARFRSLDGDVTTPSVTEALFGGDIRALSDLVANYLDEKDDVWILVDNLDKGWPTRGATSPDILIIRTLLDATRKLQRELERREVNFHCLVFLRNDIYEHLVIDTPDKGKDTPVVLDWSDPELFKQLFLKRVLASGLLEGTFDKVWHSVFAANVGTRDSFSYLVERTLMRPRDFLTFVQRAIEVAINRGHKTVEPEDVIQAEESYSEDLFQNTVFELNDVYRNASDFLYEFLASKARLTKTEVLDLLSKARVEEGELDAVVQLLVWSGFLGVQTRASDEVRYSFEVRYDVPKLMAPVERDGGYLVVHPAFRSALETFDNL